MSVTMTACKNPQQCRVRSHISGSEAARQCGTSQAVAASSRASNVHGLATSSGRSASGVASLLGASNGERSADFDEEYGDEIDREAQAIEEGKCPSYRMPSTVAGVDVEYTATGLRYSDVGASAAVILPDGVRVAAYDRGAQTRYTLKDGETVSGWCSPVIEDSTGSEANADGILTREQYDLLSKSFDTCNEDFFSENCENNRELAARLLWERENARAIHGG